MTTATQLPEHTVVIGGIKFMCRYDYEPAYEGGRDEPSYGASIQITELGLNGVWLDGIVECFTEAAMTRAGSSLMESLAVKHAADMQDYWDNVAESRKAERDEAREWGGI